MLGGDRARLALDLGAQEQAVVSGFAHRGLGDAKDFGRPGRQGK